MGIKTVGIRMGERDIGGLTGDGGRGEVGLGVGGGVNGLY
jgi:hypothetical protein